MHAARTEVDRVQSVPGTVPKPLLQSVMPGLDAVRGLAVLVVVTYHGFFWNAATDNLRGAERLIIFPFQGGWLGVQLFFVLSGFLITGILLDTRRQRHYYRRFYLNRALRILPAYIALLILLAVLRVAQMPFLIVSLLFLSNVTALLGIPMQYPPLWSLAVEEQFYLLWPFAVQYLSERSLTLLAGAIVFITPLVRYLAWNCGATEGLFYYTWFVMDGLAMGALIALFTRDKKTTRRRAVVAGTLLGAAGAALLILGEPFGILHRATLAGATFQLTPWHFLFASLILFVLVAGSWPRSRIVSPAWLRYLGRISYGLYLIHVLAFDAFDHVVEKKFLSRETFFRGTAPGLALRFVIAGGFAILAASLSREYFESFFLRFKYKPQSPEIAEQPGI